ncbi:HAMP domain-containing protein [Romboutsia weinsteinii]|uniref:HAMP domain-containing protein n=1 Tax=Romboutsia weinsteinii TaxID=2020949 RepID=A0A371JAC2_9FIRM|nr:histidine kinase [Romboutsia weinsteinii]RDY29704.1 HAMP domain-containing protein [Romboutsia weinsteinii]
MKKLYYKYINKKLFNKMLLIYSSITIISICLLANIFLSYYTDNEIQNELNIHSEVIFNIEKRFEEQDIISNSVINGINTQKKITDEINMLISSTYEEYLSYKLDNFSVNSNKVDLRYLLDTMLSNRRDVLAVVINDKDKNFVGEIVLSHDKWYKIKNIKDDRNYIRKITKPIKNVDDLYTSGYIDIYFDLKELNSLLLKSNIKGSLGIIDENKDIIFDSGKLLSKEYIKDDKLMEKTINESIESVYRNDYITYIKEDAQTKYKYISIIPKDDIGLNNIRAKIFMISLVCICMIILTTYVVIYNHSKKLKYMMIAMKDIQDGNLDVRFNINNEDDELDTIAIGIDQMCENLQYNINKTYISEVKQKQAEINALQAQIKPHFLYNTLEVIRMCALASKNTQVAQMIYNLACMFRYSTYNNGVFVKLSEEIKYCKMYLDLCCTRYKGVLDYSIEMDNSLDEYMIPKFVLQPIVENSISHGMRKDVSDNFIKIKVNKIEEHLEISIEDNGFGIECEVLEKIEKELEQNLQKPNSIGLMNINSRLKLKFGENYGISINSEKLKGTVVKLKIPISKGDEEYV